MLHQTLPIILDHLGVVAIKSKEHISCFIFLGVTFHSTFPVLSTMTHLKLKAKPFNKHSQNCHPIET